jgi:hypothetical protein
MQGQQYLPKSPSCNDQTLHRRQDQTSAVHMAHLQQPRIEAQFSAAGLNQVHVMQTAGQRIAQVKKAMTAPDCNADNDNQKGK